jgi:hypothetical protein
MGWRICIFAFLLYSNIKYKSSTEATNLIFSIPVVTHCTNPARISHLSHSSFINRLGWGRFFFFYFLVASRILKKIAQGCPENWLNSHVSWQKMGRILQFFTCCSDFALISTDVIHGSCNFT